MMNLLDEEGLTSVVATNCEQKYGRPLVVGDRLLVRSVIESISDPKRTALGTGRFLTTRLDYVAVPDTDVPVWVTDGEVQALYDAGEPVATMRFRILKYLPPEKTPAPARPPRPRPAITQDNAFWFEGARAHRLLVQHCTSCGTLRHPPLPACGHCGSLDWDTVESSGRGTLYSYVVVHYPQVPSFEYPLPIGLIELEEGTRRRGQSQWDGTRRHHHRHAAASAFRRLRRGAVAAGIRTGRCRRSGRARRERRVSREGSLSAWTSR